MAILKYCKSLLQVLLEVIEKNKNLDEMVENLSENPTFLKSIARKLGIPESSIVTSVNDEEAPLKKTSKKDPSETKIRLFGPAVPPLLVAPIHR